MSPHQTLWPEALGAAATSFYVLGVYRGILSCRLGVTGRIGFIAQWRGGHVPGPTCAAVALTNLIGLAGAWAFGVGG